MPSVNKHKNVGNTRGTCGTLAGVQRLGTAPFYVHWGENYKSLPPTSISCKHFVHTDGWEYVHMQCMNPRMGVGFKLSSTV